MKNYRHGKRGADLLHDPLLNKGTAFTDNDHGDMRRLQTRQRRHAVKPAQSAESLQVVLR